MSDSADLGTIAHQAPLHGILQARILEWVAMPSSTSVYIREAGILGATSKVAYHDVLVMIMAGLYLHIK